MAELDRKQGYNGPRRAGRGVSVRGEHGKARARRPREISIRGAYKVAVYKDCHEDTRGRQEVCGVSMSEVQALVGAGKQECGVRGLGCCSMGVLGGTSPGLLCSWTRRYGRHHPDRSW